ncbi:MAG TPA: DUF1844 domain-containing protein [Polyangia bacterium]|nr:DUF1844 domain-containing protein [Polyangia bacterium]
MRNLQRMGNGDSKPSGFTVNDRRASHEEAKPAAAPAAPPAPTQADAAGAASGLPPVDFHTFILSLGSSALLHLGELEHPEAGDARQDLSMAKHTIDILAMLDEKTKGNLTPAEEKLMESLLFDLRLRYVEATKTRQ